MIGRLCDEPDCRTTQGGGYVARYRLAVHRIYKMDGKEESDFISCVAFGNTAQFVHNYIHKGMKIAIEGRIQTGSYTKDDGTKVYTTDVVVDRHEFCDSAKTVVVNESDISQPDDPIESPFHALQDDDSDLPF